MNALTAGLLSENSDRQFETKDRTLAIFDFAIPFHIIKINKVGLVFRYVGNEQWFTNPASMDVVYDGFSLKNIPVQTVSDIRVPTDMVRIRHHYVSFKGLSPAQALQLDQFIARCVH
ncbi:MAG: hypothetical protein HY885_09215 [Deltaproteobacteria bacterium]|nr:hypothetical protein [Deltaproteobacteria bacterium]